MKTLNTSTISSVISNIRNARFVFAGFFSYAYFYYYGMENRKSLMRFGVCSA